MEELKNRGGLVEVLNSYDESYVNLAYTLLQDRGFFVRVENALTNAIPGMSVGVSLMVREEDAAEAIKALVEADILPSQEESLEEITQRDSKKRWRKLMLLLLALIAALALMAIWIFVVQKQG
ncbi:hypothetical protein HMPREF3027_00225 [Porphyromonas sp. HMSC077F02]|uniref:DUF2007 domain-containing protein n=1 Tax=Porphyromonas sp. HMSC077F02 TaxID=1739529 RepID=UPI0008A458C3|nr:DUF2007 domain-containing protein [Porphyromonas sp. HMSC077F02]OFO58238.1 hypothetical protein HMPREF3027_00225 [Porphyromonas sp. HMSC077F02]